MSGPAARKVAVTSNGLVDPCVAAARPPAVTSPGKPWLFSSGNQSVKTSTSAERAWSQFAMASESVPGADPCTEPGSPLVKIAPTPAVSCRARTIAATRSGTPSATWIASPEITTSSDVVEALRPRSISRDAYEGRPPMSCEKP